VYFPRRDVGFDFVVTKKIPMTAIPQKSFERFFGLRGLAALEHDDWDRAYPVDTQSRYMLMPLALRAGEHKLLIFAQFGLER
jgi:hypothetical protein